MKLPRADTKAKGLSGEHLNSGCELLCGLSPLCLEGDKLRNFVLHRRLRLCGAVIGLAQTTPLRKGLSPSSGERAQLLVAHRCDVVEGLQAIKEAGDMV